MTLNNGSKHLITHYIEKINTYFGQKGFEMEYLDSLEDIYHNFDAVNVPKSHSAYSEQDTFFIDDMEHVLRSHTTSYQARLIEAKYPETIRSVFIGRVYRKDHSPSHCSTFHQIEGLWIEPDLNLSNLLFLLHDFIQSLFPSEYVVEFVNSYSLYTFMTVDIYVQCVFCHGSGCKYCKSVGKLRIGSGGFVHPNILKEYRKTGYMALSFAFGLERMICMLSEFPDIRKLYKNNLLLFEEVNL